MSLAQHAPARAVAESRPDYHCIMMIEELNQDIMAALKLHKPSIYLKRLRPREIEFVILPSDPAVKREFHTHISALEIGPNDTISETLLLDLFRRATNAHNAKSARKVRLGGLRAREVKVKGTTYPYFVYRIYLQGD